MTIPASTIIAEAARRLNDTKNASQRWSGTDLLTCVNDAQKMIAEARPEASIKSVAIGLAEGFEQDLPADGKKFLALVYDAGIDGTTKGKAIIEMQQAVFDMINPLWRSQTADAVVENFAPDPDFPKKFIVYPPNTGTGYAHCRYLSIPADCTAADINISLGDEYKEPLILGTLWFALADQTEDADQRNIRQDVFRDFRISIGIKDKVKKE